MTVVNAILIGTRKDDIKQIRINTDTDIPRYLGGTGTFIGQWIDHDIVIMKCREALFELNLNNNVLSTPFTRERVMGPILLIKMDEDAEPRDLAVQVIKENNLVNREQTRYNLRRNVRLSS
jgi:hypothetical protein